MPYQHKILSITLGVIRDEGVLSRSPKLRKSKRIGWDISLEGVKTSKILVSSKLDFLIVHCKNENWNKIGCGLTPLPQKPENWN